MAQKAVVLIFTAGRKANFYLQKTKKDRIRKSQKSRLKVP